MFTTVTALIVLGSTANLTVALQRRSHALWQLVGIRPYFARGSCWCHRRPTVNKRTAHVIPKLTSRPGWGIGYAVRMKSDENRSSRPNAIAGLVFFVVGIPLAVWIITLF